MFAPAGQEEAQSVTADELSAGDSYDYGGDSSDISNPYVGRGSAETQKALLESTTVSQPTFNALKGITARRS